MSRFIKYKDSIDKFLTTKLVFTDKDTNLFLLNNINKDDYIIPILMLTIMNNQNRKNKISLHGYYVASGIYLMILIINMKKDQSIHILKLGNDTYNKIIMNFVLMITNLLNMNIECFKNYISKDKIFNMQVTCSKILNENLLKLINIKLSNNILEINNIDNTSNELIKCKYKFKTNDQKILYQNIKKCNEEYIKEYIDQTYVTVSAMAVSLGWLLGCGNHKELAALSKISINFGTIVKLIKDIEDIDTDFSNNNHNYIINRGIQNTFELYTNTKSNLLELLIKYNLHTETIKDIILYFENKFDTFIDETSPDARSLVSI